MSDKTNRNIIKNMVCVALVVALTASDGLYLAASVESQLPIDSRPVSSRLIHHSEVTSVATDRDEAAPSPLVNFWVPEELGRVENIARVPAAEREGKFIIHVRDAHGSYEAQARIKELIAFLTRECGIDTILLEGGSGTLDPGLLQFFEDNSLNVKMADDLMKRGELSGAELFLVESGSGVRGVGIEDREAYLANYRVFREVLGKREWSDQLIKKLRSVIESHGSRIFNSELRDFVKSWQSWREERVDVNSFLTVLRSAALKSLNIDLGHAKSQADYPSLVRFFKAKALESKLRPEAAKEEKDALIQTLEGFENGSALSDALTQWDLDKGLSGFPEGVLPRILLERVYEALDHAGLKIEDSPALLDVWASLVFQSEIDAFQFFDEIEKLNRSLFDKLAETEVEQALIRILEDSILLEKLLHLELTRAETKIVSERSEELAPEKIVARITQAGSTVKIPKFYILRTQRLFKFALRFYQGALDRERHMTENAEAALRELGKKSAILVTGGYHSDGLKEAFSRDQFTFAEVTPRIMSVEGARQNYLTAMLGTGRTIFDLAHISQPLKLAAGVENVDGRSPQMVLGGLLQCAADDKISPPDLVTAFNKSSFAESTRSEMRFGRDKGGNFYLVIGEQLKGSVDFNPLSAIFMTRGELSLNRVVTNRSELRQQGSGSSSLASVLETAGVAPESQFAAGKTNQTESPLGNLGGLTYVSPEQVNTSKTIGRSEPASEGIPEAYLEIAKILNEAFQSMLEKGVANPEAWSSRLIQLSEQIDQNLDQLYPALNALLALFGEGKERAMATEGIQKLLVPINANAAQFQLMFDEKSEAPLSWAPSEKREEGRAELRVSETTLHVLRAAITLVGVVGVFATAAALWSLIKPHKRPISVGVRVILVLSPVIGSASVVVSRWVTSMMPSVERGGLAQDDETNRRRLTPLASESLFSETQPGAAQNPAGRSEMRMLVDRVPSEGHPPALPVKALDIERVQPTASSASSRETGERKPGEEQPPSKFGSDVIVDIEALKTEPDEEQRSELRFVIPPQKRKDDVALTVGRLLGFIIDLPNLMLVLIKEAEAATAAEQTIPVAALTEAGESARAFFEETFHFAVAGATVPRATPRVTLDADSRLVRQVLLGLLHDMKFLEWLAAGNIDLGIADPDGTLRSKLRVILESFTDPVEKAIAANLMSANIDTTNRLFDDFALSRQGAAWVETDQQLDRLASSDIFVAFAESWETVKDPNAVAEILPALLIAIGSLAQAFRGLSSEERVTLMNRLSDLGLHFDVSKGRNVVRISLDVIERIYLEHRGEAKIKVAV